MLKSELITQLKETYPDVTIIGVTKYTDHLGIEAFIKEGIIDIGENRDDSFLPKYELVDGVVWHFIGSLQTKKVKKVINKIDYLHSLDRLSLADEIEKRAEQPVKCFVQVKSTDEETKHGLAIEDVEAFMQSIKDYTKIEVVGFMTMAVETDNIELQKKSFMLLKNLKEKYNVPYLSMGMSNDFKTAIECGATDVRLGRMLYK
jgi:pyridoxal phosphate enzyme (YggS family)